MHAHKKTKKIESIARIVFFECMHCIFYLFWLRRRPCIRCVVCVAYNNLETACRHMKTDIKVGFQAAIRNATDATHAGHAMQILKGATYAMHAYEKRNTQKDRIGYVHCICRERALHIVLQSVACVAYDSLETTCRPMWHTAVYISLMNQWISSQTQHSNYVMSNYVTLRRHRPVCQFSWCPQRDMGPLWPVTKL